MQESRPPILKYSPKSSVRILGPEEYLRIREVAPFYGSRQMDALLYTGMRYVELQRLHDNPAWLDLSRSRVHLPPASVLKAKRRQLDRWVILNEKGRVSVPLFIEGRNLPGWETWTQHLKDWATAAGVNPAGLGPKTLRKTWESWLVCTYPVHLAEITLSQGHTTLTAVGHYLNMPFTAEDKAAISPYVDGMF